MGRKKCFGNDEGWTGSGTVGRYYFDYEDLELTEKGKRMARRYVKKSILLNDKKEHELVI